MIDITYLLECTQKISKTCNIYYFYGSTPNQVDFEAKATGRLLEIKLNAQVSAFQLESSHWELIKQKYRELIRLEDEMHQRQQLEAKLLIAKELKL